MIERLTVSDELYESGATRNDLNVIASWLQSVRQIFDLMPTETEQEQHNIAARMALVPRAYDGLKQTYRECAARGEVAPRRQVAACARQCAEWSAAGTGFYDGLAARIAGPRGAPGRY